MKLEIGKTYVTRDGELVSVSQLGCTTARYPFLGENKWSYTADGRVFSVSQPHGKDLVREYVVENDAPSVRSAIYACERTLPLDSTARKEIPLYRGLLAYGPAALAGAARISKKGNDKHNPGEELHHARGKSTDHPDCILRHITDVADLLATYERTHLEGQPAAEWENQLREELGQMVWRAVIWSQELHEKYLGAPLAPGARE